MHDTVHGTGFRAHEKMRGLFPFLVYSSNTALIMPSWPGRLMIRARPISVRTIAPLVRRFRRT